MVDIGLIDAGMSPDEAQLVAHDQNAGFFAQHFGRLVEDELDEARILFRFLGKLDGLVGPA